MSDPTITTSDGQEYGQYKYYNYAINKEQHTYSMIDKGEYLEFDSLSKLHDYIDKKASGKPITESILVRSNYVQVDEFESKVIDFLVKQPWFMEMIYTRKSSWVANSRGGEPNCRREEDEPYVVG
jgi:hypothetical protein